MDKEIAQGEGRLSYFALAAMIVGATLSGLTQTSMNTMLPSVVQEYGIGVSVGQWVVTAFMLCLGVTMPVVAFLSRKFSVRSLYLGSLIIFALGTVIMGFAPSFAILMCGRVMQGCATGVILPLLQVVALSQFPPQKRGTIMGFIGLSLGFAPNIGPTIGGAMQTAFGWRSFLWFLLAFTLLIFAVCFFAVRKQRPVFADDRKLDVSSLALSTLGFGGLLLGFSNASDFGIMSLLCLVPLGAGAVFLSVFVVRQLRIANPLLDMHVFREREMTTGTIAICLLFASFIGVSLVIPVELQALHGYSALQAGMIMLPGTVIALVVNPVSGMLMDKYGPRVICIVGSLLLIAGSVPMLRLAQMDSLIAVAFFQSIRSLGITSLIMPLTTWSVGSLPPAIMPDGTSVSNALRQVSAALGTSVMVLIMTGGKAGAVSAAGVNNAMLFSLIAALIMTALCLIPVKSKQRG